MHFYPPNPEVQTVRINMRGWLILLWATSPFVQAQAVESGVVKIHAPHAELFSCIEHWDGQFTHLGDALGTDCVIQGWYQHNDRMFLRTFDKLGHQNSDWYGYGKPVLAPCDCTVEATHINPVTNRPGVMQPGRASTITFRAEDETRVLYAHVDAIQVKPGDAVKAGQVVAKVGNNGFSRNPHLHIAAWRGETPIQIQFDQSTLQLNNRKHSKVRF